MKSNKAKRHEGAKTDSSPRGFFVKFAKFAKSANKEKSQTKQLVCDCFLISRLKFVRILILTSEIRNRRLSWNAVLAVSYFNETLTKNIPSLGSDWRQRNLRLDVAEKDYVVQKWTSSFIPRTCSPSHLAGVLSFRKKSRQKNTKHRKRKAKFHGHRWDWKNGADLYCSAWNFRVSQISEVRWKSRLIWTH